MRSRATILAGSLAADLLILGFAACPGAAQDPPIPSFQECFQFGDPRAGHEIYGPTDVNAQSANGRMAVGVNRQGTVTVLRWPRPSYYDQIKYRTSSRTEDRFGALENEGAFLGLVLETASGVETVWLRDLPSQQRYSDGLSDAIETRYRDDAHRLTATVTDVVAARSDLFARRVEVVLDDTSPVAAARLIAFENLNLVVHKYPYAPAQDWCGEEGNFDTAAFAPALDAIVHTKSGIDVSTGRPSSVAIGLAFAGAASGHQVGGDAYEGSALPDGRGPGATEDAYDDSRDGELSGGATYFGQTTGALLGDLEFSSRRAAETVFLVGASDASGVAEALAGARSRSFDDFLREKRAWFDDLLGEAPLPDTDDPDVLELAQRALVTLVSTYDPESGAIVASIATQSPYGEDWIRDGAFFNHVLDLIGRRDWVTKRNLWYASLQSKPGLELGRGNPFAESFERALVPPGNWAMNYYADGVVGGPIPWEIDETGYGLWTLWDHYEATGDEDYLAAVYPAIRLAADFLVGCRDASSGLQCPAVEDDNVALTQTIIGAGAVWLGLGSAVAAAEALGEIADAGRWRERRDELGAAIEEHLRAGGVYGEGDPVIVWPVCFHDYDDPRFEPAHYEALWARLAPSFAEPEAGAKLRGAYESKGLIALAKAKKGEREWLERVRSGIDWVAKRHAEPDTHVMGEAWLVENGDVVSTVSQPHLWEQVLFYLAALEAYPPNGLGLDETEGCGGVVTSLRAASGRPAHSAGRSCGSGTELAGVALLACLRWRRRNVCAP